MYVFSIYNFLGIRHHEDAFKPLCQSMAQMLTKQNTNPLPQNEKKHPLKTLWEKDKMLVTSILPFSYNVFYPSQKQILLVSYVYFVVHKFFQFGPVQ